MLSRIEVVTARRAAAIGIATMMIYGVALTLLARRSRDVSIFVVAGRSFTDPHETRSRILVRNDAGYDGQFYYRMAVAPFSVAARAGGVRFDVPAYRLSRPLYPMLAALVAGGRAAFVPATLVAVNLVAIGAVASFAALLADNLLAGSLAATWPGLLSGVSHDTTEPVAAALMLAALLARERGRRAAFAAVGALAVLARETTALPLLAALLPDLARRGGRAAAVAAGAVMLTPALMWRVLVQARVGGRTNAVADNIGTPFLGVLAAVRRDVARLATLPAHAHHMLRFVEETAVATDLGIVVLVSIAAAAAATARALPSRLRLAFLVSLLLATTLRPEGPWIEPVAITRTLDDLFLLGCLMVAGCPRPRAAMAATGMVSVALFAMMLRELDFVFAAF